MTKLNEVEVRVLGALAEKEITTPDYYPLSLNALINACNQKSNRSPVMALDESAVRQALDSLNEKSLAGHATSADSRVPKFACRKSSTLIEEKWLCSVCFCCVARRLRANYADVQKGCTNSTTPEWWSLPFIT
jgi:uncharacterized protein YceH (UPF0502 family)